MFVEMLSVSEKECLMHLLIAIASADGDVTDSERQFLIAYAAENNVPFDFNQSPMVLEDACKGLASGPTKVVVLQELVKIALVDGVYDESERRGMVTIASLLGVGSDLLTAIETWVVDGKKWLEAGLKMVSDSPAAA